MRQHFAYCAPLNCLAPALLYRNRASTASAGRRGWPWSNPVKPERFPPVRPGLPRSCHLFNSWIVWYAFTVSADRALRFRLDPKTRRLLDRLRDERHVNISSWARKHILSALRVEFPDEFQDHEERPEQTAGETPEPHRPIPGWKPRKIGNDEAGRDVWGAALQGPEVRNLVRAARAVIAERVGRGIATPAERLTVAALDEMPDEDDDDAVRAWAPSAAFRDAVRLSALATLALYVGIVETLADDAARDDGGGETMH